MSAKAIREYDGKNLLAHWLVDHDFKFTEQYVHVGLDTDVQSLLEDHPWLLTTQLVVKVDQLIKRRGHLGLVKLNATWDEATAWIEEYRNKEVKAGQVSGVVDTFILVDLSLKLYGVCVCVCVCVCVIIIL